MKLCGRCNGAKVIQVGTKSNGDPIYADCPTCGGTGWAQ